VDSVATEDGRLAVGCGILEPAHGVERGLSALERQLADVVLADHLAIGAVRSVVAAVVARNLSEAFRSIAEGLPRWIAGWQRG
jgi:hypothetical protein